MKSMEMDAIFNILEREGCNPEYIEIDDHQFSRTISFSTPYLKCWIVWWTNISYLHIADRYGCSKPFTHIFIETCSPTNNKQITFCTKKDIFENNFYLVLKKLDWQERKQ